ncbi:PREDICTED: BTB/POZ and MATH domain-containing protein 6-like, partial [Camelina sativa]|uniref:BTB/POZ and MATH domain-containing protein 6-like n=1 Tax=Camelina sativa TaxID=90675 RepID=A0ABM1RTZ7_CAMSA
MIMKSYYKETLCVVSLFSCLFITSSFAGPPVPNQLENDSQKLIPTQISSRDSKVSLSSTVKGLRERPPSSYSLKFESFNTLMKSIYTDSYQSRPFRVGRYNWTLVVYPKGNKNDNGTGYISLYVVLDNSTLTSPREEVHADLRFYIFNKKQKKYFTFQDTDVWRFSAIKTMWGFSKVLPLTTFNN